MKHTAVLAVTPFLALVGLVMGCSGGDASPTPETLTPTAAPGTPTEAPATPTQVPETPTDQPDTPTLPPPPTPTADQEVYLAAVDDAAVPEDSEIVDTLVEITQDNPDLAWQNDRVKMVTWTGWTGYDTLVGQETTLTREVWLTAAPFTQLFCKSLGLTGDDLDFRMEQLLGLPPNNGKTRFVSFYVSPADMFRPCKDPEITDNTCGLDFPVGTSQEHIDWVTNLQETSYGTGGYPWTQLGYTYDWYEDESDVGMSEFVVRAGATVKVDAVAVTKDFCGPRG